MTRHQYSLFFPLAGIALLAVLETGVYLKFRTELRPSALLAYIPAEEATEYLRNTPHALLVDVRTYREYTGAHLPGAINIPFYTLTKAAASLPADKPIILYCFTGLRSAQAYKNIRRLRPDITDVRYVKGQIIAPRAD